VIATRLLIALALILVPVAAAAGPRPLAQTLEGEAKKAYDDARIAFDAGDYHAALLKFDKAHQLSHDPRLLWNMAGSHARLRHYARALALLDRYVSGSGDALTAADRRDAEDKRRTIAAFVGTLDVRVREPGATVFVDGERVGETPLGGPLRLDQGTHRVRVGRRGYRERIEVVAVEGGGSTTVDLALVRAQGNLSVTAGREDKIAVDGGRRATGRWRGSLAVGSHDIEVTSPNGDVRRRRIVLADGESERVRFAEPESPLVWPWIVGGVALTLGAMAVTSYFVLKPAEAAGPTPGTLGVFELP